MENTRERIRLAAGQSFRLLRWNRNVSNVEVVLGANSAVPVTGHGHHWHYHRASELTYIKQGSGTRLVADHIEHFEPGDLILIGPNVPHYWQLKGRSSGLAIQWDFPMEHGIWSFEESEPLRQLTELSKRGLRILGRTAELTRSNMESLTGVDGFARLANFLSLIAELTRASDHDIKPLSDKTFSLSGSDAHQEAMRQSVSYILAHYREPVHLEALLRLTGMSRATFTRQFRHHAGKSFSSFLNQVRLQAVCKELRQTTELVSNIAFNNGFNQLSFFNRLFRREFGINPSEYRDQQAPSALSKFPDRFSA